MVFIMMEPGSMPACTCVTTCFRGWARAEETIFLVHHWELLLCIIWLIFSLQSLDFWINTMICKGKGEILDLLSLTISKLEVSQIFALSCQQTESGQITFLPANTRLSTKIAPSLQRYSEGCKGAQWLNVRRTITDFLHLLCQYRWYVYYPFIIANMNTNCLTTISGCKWFCNMALMSLKKRLQC
jgi:hypothetical protein